jgi:hypothetical protein
MRCNKCGTELTNEDMQTTDCICNACRKNKDMQVFGMYGWICPRCGKVHSPFSTECSCPPPIKVWTGTTTYQESPQE